VVEVARRDQGPQSLWDTEKFLTALQMRFLLPIHSLVGVGETLHCTCTRHTDLILNPNHCTDCELNRGLQTRRHTMVRNALADYLKGFGQTVDLEVNTPLANVRADIRIRSATGLTRYIDVSICNQGCDTYVNCPSGNGPGSAIEIRERLKILRYAGLQNADGVFVPFVLETAGGLGSRALAFIRSLSDNGGRPPRSFTKSECFSEMNAAILQSGAAMRLQSTRTALSHRLPPAIA
jgi:hypothetical protein